MGDRLNHSELNNANELKAGKQLLVPEYGQNITREKIKRMLPKGSSVSVTNSVLELIANMENDTGLPQDLMEEDFMSYMHLLGKKKGNSLTQLVNALKYCNLKRTINNQKAWSIVFPEKYDKLIAEGKAVDNHVGMYNTTWLVQEIDKAMIIPVHLSHYGTLHKFLNHQMQLAMGEGGIDPETGDKRRVSAMVMHLATKDVLERTAQPETATLDIKISASEKSIEIQQDQVDTLKRLADIQQNQFRRGAAPIDIQKVHIIEEAIEAQTVDNTSDMLEEE